MSYYQTIYNRIRQAGYSEAAALGFLGNWDCESNCEPARLQGDFSSYRTASLLYVSRLSSGVMSREVFGNDQKGFGLAQWTHYARKLALYDFWKRDGRAIDDVTLQTDFALYELKTDLKGLAAEIRDSKDVYSCADLICRKYECPAAAL